MRDLKISFFIITACFICTAKSTPPVLEEGRYFYFSDEEDVIHRIDILKRTNETDLVRPNEKDIVYWLNTRNHSQPEKIYYQIATQENTTSINPDKVTVVLIHGWMNDKGSPVNTELTKAFLHNADVNVVVVDWSSISNNIYYMDVAALVPEVGKLVGEFINWLNGVGVSFEHMHVVGFSLGAHVAGVAGRHTESKIRRITGLDPAGPLFEITTSFHLDKTDAQYVEVIHTNTALFGVDYPCGHADFYPNGGSLMPGCILNVCSHTKSYYYMAQTVTANDMIAHKCLSMDQVNENLCDGVEYPMGNSDLSKNGSGLYRVNTITQTYNKI